MIGPWRLRNWLIGSAMGGMMLFGASKVNFSWGKSFSSPKASTADIAKLKQIAKNKFEIDYTTNSALEKLAASGASRSELTAAMMSAYGRDTMTTKEVFDTRSNLHEYWDPAYEEASKMYADAAGVGLLVPTKHKITSSYGKRIDPVLRKQGIIVEQNHRAVDFAFSANEPIIAAKDVVYDGAKKDSRGLPHTDVIYQDKKNTLKFEVYHNKALSETNEFGVAVPEIGDTVEAGTPFAINAGRDVRTTGENTHIQVKQKDKKGNWVRYKGNPTKLITSLFQTSPGFTKARKNMNPYVSGYLASHSYDDMPFHVDSLRQSEHTTSKKAIKANKKKADLLETAYQGYEKFVNKKTDSLIWAAIAKDEQALMLAFAEKPQAPNTEMLADAGKQNPAASSSIQMGMVGALDINAIASSVNKAVTVEKNVKAETDAATTEAAATSSVSSVSAKAAWTKKYRTLDVRSQRLHDVLVNAPNAISSQAETGIAIEDIADDILSVSAERENKILDPKLTNGKDGSTATSFGQQTKDNRETLKKAFPNLPKWPKRNKVDTDEGVAVIGQYMLANYVYNIREHKKADERFKKKHDGHGLYDQTYIRADNGEAVYMTYRRGATSAWGGYGAFNKSLERQQEKAIKDKKPYAKFHFHSCGQDFTDYVELSHEDHSAVENNALNAIKNDASLSAYYRVDKKASAQQKTVTEKFAASKDTAVRITLPTMQSRAASDETIKAFSGNYTTTSTADTGTVIKYELKQN